MSCALPLIHFLPQSVEPAALGGDQQEINATRRYQCPLYRTSKRAGVLTTTGASSNYVIDVCLPIERDPAFFVLQGTACLTQLDE